MLREQQRVETRPHTDAFMQGDRYGTIVKIGKNNAVSVRMDRSGRVRVFPQDSVKPVTAARKLPQSAVGRKCWYITPSGRKVTGVIDSIDSATHPSRYNVRITATKDPQYARSKLVNTPPAFVQAR